MSDSKKDFCIILWSTEDIKIDTIDLKRALEIDSDDANITIVNLEDIKQMKIKNLKRLLDNYSDKSALLVCSSEEDLDNLDFWKLGFVMGKMPVQSKDGKKRVISYSTENKTSLFEELSELFEICDTELEIKYEMKYLMKSVGIETKFELKEFTTASNIAKTEKDIS